MFSSQYHSSKWESLLFFVPFRVLRLPAVGVAADIVQGLFCFPMQFAVRLGGIGVAFRRIAGTAGGDFIRYFYPVRLFVGVYHLQNGMAGAGTEVVNVYAGFYVFVGGGVPFDEVRNVDVVAYSRSIGGGVVVPEDVKFRPPSDRHLGDVGHQVVRDPAGVFPDLAARVGADGVEVAEKGYRKTGVRGGEVGQDFLVHQLRAAVGVDAAGRFGLFERDVLAGSVDCGARTEDQFVYSELRHCLAEGKGGIEVVLVVFERLLDRLADRLVACEVDDCVDLVFCEDFSEFAAVADVSNVKGRVAACKTVDPKDRFDTAVREVVDNDNIVTLSEKGQCGVGTDVAGTAG